MTIGADNVTDVKGQASQDRDWFELKTQVSYQSADSVANFLMEMGSLGIQLDEASSDPFVKLTAYFHRTTDPEKILFRLDNYLRCLLDIGSLTSILPPLLRDLKGLNWEAKRRLHFPPVRISEKIIIIPPWGKSPSKTEVNAPLFIVIDPKMAFGTGKHETTQVALLLLEKTIRKGDFVLDVGTGTGIQSIAAAKLGAERIVGVDIDPQAIRDAGENLTLNNVSSKVRLQTGTVTDIAARDFDLIVANIETQALLPCLDRFEELLKPRGRVIFSGILASEEDLFSSKLKERGFENPSSEKMGQWVGISAISKGT